MNRSLSRIEPGRRTPDCTTVTATGALPANAGLALTTAVGAPGYRIAGGGHQWELGVSVTRSKDPPGPTRAPPTGAHRTRRIAPHQSALMFASLISLDHRAPSSARNFENSSGDPPSGKA